VRNLVSHIKEKPDIEDCQEHVRKMSAPEGEEVTAGWIGTHDKEIGNLYSLQNIIRLIKSGRM
jgi:hypothetical protein